MKVASVLAAAAAGAALIVVPGSSAHATGCLPEAIQPHISGSQGAEDGYLPCGGTYTIKLVNNAGSALDSYSGTLGSAGYVPPTLRWTVCSGAIVHTFLYVNINGTGMSDTSSSIQC